MPGFELIGQEEFLEVKSVFDDGGAEEIPQPSEGICSVSSKHLIKA